MITRFSGLTPTRSRAVVHDNLVFTVAVTPGTRLRRFSTCMTHDAHVIPSIARSTVATGSVLSVRTTPSVTAANPSG